MGASISVESLTTSEATARLNLGMCYDSPHGEEGKAEGQAGDLMRRHRAGLKRRQPTMPARSASLERKPPRSSGKPTHRSTR